MDAGANVMTGRATPGAISAGVNICSRFSSSPLGLGVIAEVCGPGGWVGGWGLWRGGACVRACGGLMGSWDEELTTE